MRTNKTILIVDKNPKTGNLMSAYLSYKGYDVVIFDNERSLSGAIRELKINVVIAELNYLNSIVPDFKERLLEKGSALVLIGYGSQEKFSVLRQCGEEKMFFLTDPVNLDELESIVIRIAESLPVEKSSATGEFYSQSTHLHSAIVGRSRPMRELFEMIEKVANSHATVLIQGESGTGKELAARAIHDLSGRSDKKFIPINCGAIPDDLLESELFGHIKGSFTGAYANRIGRFEMADKGTLFLDEIGDMKAALQVKLLRVLQTREVEPVGSTKSQKVDVRIIAATNKNLEELVADRLFREDLYYRLSVIPVSIPPLRERREDIPLLIDNFLKVFNSDRRYSVEGFSREALDILCDYEWPGNVRELENLVERLVIIKNRGFITPSDLPEKYLANGANGNTRIQKPNIPEKETELPPEGISLNAAVEEFENRLILQALERTNGNKKEAAELLNLKRTTLIEKLKKRSDVYRQ